MEHKGLAFRKWKLPLGDVGCKPWVFHEFKVPFNLFLVKMNRGWLGYGSHRSLSPLWKPSGKGVSFASTNVQIDVFLRNYAKGRLYDCSKEKQ